MEIDAKAATLLFAAVAGGQTVGAGAGGTLESVLSTESPGAHMASLETRVQSLESGLRERVVEAQEDHRQTRQMLDTAVDTISKRIDIAVEALDERITRLDERKADK